MCGIVGVVHRTAAAAAAVLQAAADTLAARGPDGSGVWVEGPAGLGHRRLAILDLSPAGHQPMLSADGRYVAILNGEIYNFRELRRALGEGPWRSEGDTEVVLAAYARWGPGCLERFHGMFALAIWDRREHRLFAARDRMGVKPFYYHHGPEGFAFASRPRALFTLQPALSREFDAAALRLYLEAGYVPAPRAIYRAVGKLPPGHWLTVDAGGLRVERYWDFRTIAPEPAWRSRPEGELVEELDELVSRSVQLRLVSDVPLGAFLSGGIDSSLVVAMMARHASGPVRTFTIGFHDPRYDESRHAAAVARHLATDHHCEMLEVDDLLALMPRFGEAFDEPFFDNSAVATLAVSRLARRQVTVSLSGDGGDELFGGYHYYPFLQRLRPVFRLPVGLRRWLARPVAGLPRHRLRLLGAALGQPDLTAAFAFARSVVKDFSRVFAPDLLASTQGLGARFAEAARAFPPGLEPAEVGMRLDALFTLPDDYLQKVDVASMAYSLESREPLLDHTIIEWAMRLPLDWKLRGGAGKYLLRQLAYRYVPRPLLDRPKRGFGVPISAWLRGPLRAWAAERLSDPRLFQRLPLRRDRVWGLWELHQSGARDAHPLLWAILVLLDFAAREPAAAGLSVPIQGAR